VWPAYRARVTRVLETVGLAAGRTLGPHRDDHAGRGIDRNLPAVHQMRAMPGLVARLGVWIGAHELAGRAAQAINAS
jgi:hypothetical protein